MDCLSTSAWAGSRCAAFPFPRQGWSGETHLGDGFVFADGIVANFCQTLVIFSMGTMNISLPEPLKQFVEEQVVSRGYTTSSEYVRELIRMDQDRQRLRGLLMEGTDSPVGLSSDAGYFGNLRERVRTYPAS